MHSTDIHFLHFTFFFKKKIYLLAKLLISRAVCVLILTWAEYRNPSTLSIDSYDISLTFVTGRPVLSLSDVSGNCCKGQIKGLMFGSNGKWVIQLISDRIFMLQNLKTALNIIKILKFLP